MNRGGDDHFAVAVATVVVTVVIVLFIWALWATDPISHHNVGWHQIVCIERATVPHCATGEEIDGWMRQAGR